MNNDEIISTYSCIYNVEPMAFFHVKPEKPKPKPKPKRKHWLARMLDAWLRGGPEYDWGKR